MPFSVNPESVYGPRAAIICGPLTAGDCCAIERAGLHHVVIGSTSDISNLRRIRGLRQLDVLAVEPVDLGPVSDLVELQSLSIGGNWRGNISLAELKDLKIFGGDLKRPRSSISGIIPSSKLRYAHGNFSEPNLLALSRCQGLKTLVVSLTKFRSLDWLEGGVHLQTLAFIKCSILADIEQLRHLSQLRFLKFQQCRKLGKLDPIGPLCALQTLLLDECGNIESLSPIEACVALRLLSFIGDTKVLDGRISVLAPRAKELLVRFVNRPNYDLQASSFNFDDRYLETAYNTYMKPERVAYGAPP